MRLEEAKRDQYRRLARKEGYRARSAYKLVQIDRRYRVFRPGDVVIDFGCAPGGWLQVASKAVGEGGFILGVDLREVAPPNSNVATVAGDVNDPALSGKLLKHLPTKGDVILSDLSPQVSGIWEVDCARQMALTEKVLELLPSLLSEGGTAVLKAFEGGTIRHFVSRLRRSFERVTISKPPASRPSSSEIYLVCRGFLG